MSIRILQCNKNDLDKRQLGHLHQIINESYINSERIFWGEGYERISLVDLENLLIQKKLIVAFSDENPIGCIRIESSQRVNSGIFSMLSVDNFYRKNGVGLNLVKNAETWSKNKGFNYLELELLIPQAFEHPDKVFLDKWYKTLGYMPFHKADFGEVHPELIDILLIPCDFVVYRKVL